MGYQISPRHVEYVKFEPKEICVDNRTLQFQSMIMSSTHCLTSSPGMNNVTHSETHSQSTLHSSFIYESLQVRHSPSHSFQQPYNDHFKFYEIIESWLEKFYMSAFHMNNNTGKFDMMGGDFLE